jgi:hypothetical protein
MPKSSGDTLNEPAEDLFEEEEELFEEAAGGKRGLSDEQLEEMYDSETFRIVTQRNDFLIPNLLESIRTKEYWNLNPPYQRRLRWDRGRKSKLIESLLMNVPIPPIFLFETELARYEVVDGQQRLATIHEFFSDQFVLSGLERWSGLNGKKFSRLPGRIQAGLWRRSLAAVILLAESGRTGSASDVDAQRAIKRFVFERLNTGGVKLNAQEIRNAVFDSAFNRLLHQLSRERLFTAAWNIPPREAREDKNPSEALSRNAYFRSMLDCEIVLRFFALSEPQLLRTSMKSTLDKAIERHAECGQGELDRMRRDFLWCLQAAVTIYGRRTFRLLPQKGTRHRPLSRPLYDAVMLGLYRLCKSASESEREHTSGILADQKVAIVGATDQLLKDSRNYELLIGRPNTRSAILSRIDLMGAVFQRVVEA